MKKNFFEDDTVWVSLPRMDSFGCILVDLGFLIYRIGKVYLKELLRGFNDTVCQLVLPELSFIQVWITWRSDSVVRSWGFTFFIFKKLPNNADFTGWDHSLHSKDLDYYLSLVCFPFPTSIIHLESTLQIIQGR